MTNLFDYNVIDHGASRTLFLLHGTGGGKNDFLFLDELLQQQYNLVGLQGNTDENGMARFFKRYSEGQFDQDSLAEETAKLGRFIVEWQQQYRLSPQQTYGLGYSNGANILLSLLATQPDIVHNFILLHPMLPFSFDDLDLDLTRHHIFVSSSPQDPIIPPEQSQDVIEALRPTNAALIHTEFPYGHQIGESEIKDVVKFLLQHR